MALVCAINLYFVVSYLPSLPHPAYFGLVALLAAAYLCLTTYLVLQGLRGALGMRETRRGGHGRGLHRGFPRGLVPALRPSRSPLPQVWTCSIAHGATLLAHSSHQRFLYGVPEEQPEPSG